MISPLIKTGNGSPACGDHEIHDEPSSIHSASIPEIYEIPMDQIHRPLLSVLNEDKVRSMMETIRIKGVENIPPIDVLWYEVPSSGNNYFFAMAGCHRWEAFKRLDLPLIRAKLIRTTFNDLKIYFGASLSHLQ